MQKIRNKKIYLILGIFLLFISLFLIFYLYLNNKNILINETKKSIIPNNIAIMLETEEGSGIYKESHLTSWPAAGYKYNSSKSYCVNGSVLTYDKTNLIVTVKTQGSDKCYVYYNLIAPDIKTIVSTNGINDVTVANHANYDVSSNCTIGSSTFNKKDWSLDVTLSPNTNCSVTYTTNTTNQYLNSYLISLLGTTQGTGEIVNENGYRYEGINPNNYIWFNNEMWRIIGIFDSTNHGQSGNLVKIIKNDPLGGLVWNIAEGVTWGTGTTCNSSLCHLLNEYYYNGTDYPYDFTSVSNFCSCGYGSAISNCNYSKNGITSATYRNMIATARWNNSLISSISNAPTTYGYDMVTTNTYTGKIGLMYASDYGYGVLSDVCDRTKSLTNYGGSNNGLICSGQNWLCGKGDQWLISQDSTSRSWYMADGRGLFSMILYISYLVRPALYLSSNVYVLDGDGSYNDPYIIGM